MHDSLTIFLSMFMVVGRKLYLGGGVGGGGACEKKFFELRSIVMLQKLFSKKVGVNFPSRPPPPPPPVPTALTFDALAECVNQFSPNLSHMVSHGLSLLAPHFNDLYSRSLPGTMMPIIDFLTAHVKYLSPCKGKNNFLTRGWILQIFEIKEVFGSQTNVFHIRSDGFHKCITATEVIVRPVQFMDIETVH